MLASKKAEGVTLNDETGSTQGFSKQRINRPKKLGGHGAHQAANSNNQQQEKDKNQCGNWSANSDRAETSSAEKKLFKPNQQKKVPVGIGNRVRPTPKQPINNKMPSPAATSAPATIPANAPSSSLNKYRIQIRKFLQSIEEYRKLESNLRVTHEALVAMRKEILDSMDVEPGEIPDVQSSISDVIQGITADSKAPCQQSRLTEVERECSEIREAFTAVEEEKKKLEETLDLMNSKLKCKEEELLKVKENGMYKNMASGEGDVEEIELLKQTISKLDQENSDMIEKLKRYDGDKGEIRDDQKIRSLEKLIESLHVEIKKLKDQLKVEKEIRCKLETENEKLSAEINDLKSLSSSSDSKYIILEKDNKIQDLQKRLNEISRIRPHQTAESQLQEVFKVDFSADTPSLVNQLAKFVQLYEELSREGFDLETKLKDAHMEIYRLEQILEKQLIKIKEQDECLKSMEESLSKVVVETRKSSRTDGVGLTQLSKCKCDEFQILIREKEEFSEKLKEKMSLLYQKYKQYKSECNLMRKKLDAFEKRSWLKKLVNI